MNVLSAVFTAEMVTHPNILDGIPALIRALIRMKGTFISCNKLKSETYTEFWHNTNLNDVAKEGKLGISSQGTGRVNVHLKGEKLEKGKVYIKNVPRKGIANLL